jgi:hypothetical protein
MAVRWVQQQRARREFGLGIFALNRDHVHAFGDTLLARSLFDFLLQGA